MSLAKKAKLTPSVSSVEKERARIRAWRDEELFDADAARDDEDEDDEEELVLSVV